ncbi:FIST signal transduction protein [Aeromonas sp. FDAARGOS 1417]|uniref:FIST signal transduction protein n=1 Tax=Aeromonas TaxID=642 RepID=UPI001C21A12C|nr:FIST C-terminal domain-containing protein [Aeromonas sp. FDAARGOS 1417]QWZ64399.1 FIST C-terminal domain-containing protein [Aeromonas sp. FDAARGOS 1417]
MKQHYVCQFNPTELAATLAPLQGGKLTILLAEQDCAQVPLLQQLCRDFNITLNGAIFPQLIGAQGLLPQGAWLLPRANPYHATLQPLTPQASAASLAHRIAEQVESMLATWPTPSQPPTLFLTFDNLIPNIASILDALYLQLANRVNYAGANAGSGSFTPLACLFDNQRQLAYGVTCTLLPSNSFPFLEHGYQLSAQPMRATSSEANKIAYIDWQPAFQKYQGLIRQQFQHTMVREELYRFVVHMPLGLLRANGDVIVRIPVEANDDGALLCAGEVAEHSILTLLKAPESATEHACSLARRLNQQQTLTRAHLLEVYYCAGRQLHFDQQTVTELHTLLTHSGAGDLAGALSLGEIGSVRHGDYPQFHNGAILCNGALI